MSRQKSKVNVTPCTFYICARRRTILCLQRVCLTKYLHNAESADCAQTQHNPRHHTTPLPRSSPPLFSPSPLTFSTIPYTINPDFVVMSRYQTICLQSVTSFSDEEHFVRCHGCQENSKSNIMLIFRTILQIA